MAEQDPGTGGKKLSKSDSEVKLDARNKSYNKVLDSEVAWIEAMQLRLPTTDELYVRWQKKAEWHEKEFGW